MYKSKYANLMQHLMNEHDLILLDSEQQEIEKWLDKDLTAINYTSCCTTLKAGDTPTFKQWLKLKKIPKVDNLYYYKGKHFFLIEINNIYKEWCRLHL